MKITFILPFAGLAGGIRVVATYAERLQQRGHDVHVISLPPDSVPLLTQLKSVLKGKGWVHRPEPLSHLDGRGLNHHILERARPITDADAPDGDVVIATWWLTAEWVAKLSPSKGAKAYFIQHLETFEGQPKERVKATWRLPLHKIIIAQWLVNLAKTEFKDSQISFVPNSVELSQFYAPPRTKQPVPTIGLMYSLLNWKGCDISLKAIELAKQTIPDLQVVAFGEAEAPSPKLPLPPGSRYVSRPPQDSLKTLYAQCDAWLFGSRFEGFGMPILEAMACRTPVIGTPAGAAPELLTEGAGILVQPEDPEDMARAIVQIVTASEAEWQTMSDAAYHRATRYTWDDATTLFEAALQRAIDRSPAGVLMEVSSSAQVDPQPT